MHGDSERIGHMIRYDQYCSNDHIRTLIMQLEQHQIITEGRSYHQRSIIMTEERRLNRIERLQNDARTIAKLVWAPLE